MKSKKGLVDLAEEMERAKQRAKLRTMDVSLIENDVLRPWTIDLSYSGRMRTEAEKLDMTQTYTTPQKWAGIRGMSVLEAKPDGFEKLPLFVKKQVRMQEEDYEPTPPLSDKRDDKYDAAKSSSKLSTGKKTTSTRRDTSDRLPSSQRSNTVPTSTSTSAAAMKQQMEDDEDASGIEYISRMQRSIYINSMKNIRKQGEPLHTIKYVPFKKKPSTAFAGENLKRSGIGFRSPTKLAMMKKASTNR